MAQRIAVIGSGGIGGVIAEAAHAAGHEVTMCVRTPFERLVLDAPEGTSEIPVEVATDPGAVGECDWIVLTTKVHDVPGTAPWLNKLDDGSTPLVVVQNGVAHRESVAELGVRAPVLPALIYVGAERTGPGRVVRRSPTTMQVEGGELGSRFVALLEGSAVKLRPTDDFHTAAWRKMLTNVAPNPITALTLRRLDVLADDDVRSCAPGSSRRRSRSPGPRARR
ncbi:2-dehydropantoate 2-reductase N-terminal domain-containing protein [Saccharopolyspora sp. ID03-671]|uniref:2-dehydropantoate 2-reductase N-terminal domain-containing protein n=1 Tax=Saccharopolyspora sp. ID03-671 TaxID=3073066 RepID=UPI0032447228